MAEPMVSVVTIVRDGERYLEGAIRSIREQTFRDLEHIVVDDGSVDGTPEIIRKCAEEDPRVRPVRLSPSGIPVARNRGIEESRGKYMAVLDADDLAMPDRLEQQVAFMESRPEVGMVGGGELALDVGTPALREIRYPTTHERIRSVWLWRQVFTHSTTMMRRSVLTEVGGYSRSLPRGSDPHLWARIAGRSKVANLPDILAVRRYHPGQLTRRRELASTGLSLRIRWGAAVQLRLPPWYYPLLVVPLLSGMPTSLKKWLRRRAGHEESASWSALDPVLHLLEDEIVNEIHGRGHQPV